jgi:hypothetical protein
MHGAVPPLPVCVRGVYRVSFSFVQSVVWEELMTCIVIEMLRSVDRS